jgi:hypothetical protein
MSAFSVSEPFPTFHDRDGQPLDAGFLYFGTAGLPAQSSPIPVYIDAALTIPAAQPVRTTNGFPVYAGAACRLYVDADDFSVAVHDSDNTLVFSTLNATVRIPLASTTGNISADRVNYSEGSTGATTRTVASKLRESVSVFDFMTPAQIADVQAGTLFVDVTAPINAALLAADEVYFPEGAYYVSNGGTSTDGAIQVLNGTTGKVLRGAGRGNTVLRNFGSGPCISSIGNAIFANVSVNIRDLTIQGQLGTTQGILCDYTSQSVFERIELFECGADGIKIEHGAHNALNDVWSRTNTLDGVFIGQEAYFTTITGGTFETNFRHGIHVTADGGTPPTGVTIVGASCRSNAQHNVSVADGASSVRLFGCVLECTAPATTTRHFSVDGGAATSASCAAYGTSFNGQNNAITIVGVRGNACEDLSIDGCEIDCTGSEAYALTASALGTRIVNCVKLFGAKIDASAGTTQILPDGGVYAFRRSSAFAGATTFDFGAGYASFDTTLLPNAFRFYSLNAVAIFPVMRFDAFRVWMNPLDGYMYSKNGSDPTFTNDGSIVNSGAPVPSYARGSLPTGAAGKIIRGTGFVGAAAWNTASTAMAAGAQAYLFSWDASFSDWRVFAFA